MIGAIAAHYVASGGATGYAAEVLADSPLVYLRLGDAVLPSSVADSSGNGRTGTYQGVTFGTTGLLSGDTDTCGDFPGTGNSHVKVAGGSAWINPAAFTAECLFNTDTVSGNQVIMGRVQSGAAIWMVRLDGSNLVFYVNTNGSGGWNAITSSVGIATATTYHVAATYDGTTRRLYLNGAEVANGAGGVAPYSTNTTGLALGSWYDASIELFNGRIDEFAFYGSALSASRIAAHDAAA